MADAIVRTLVRLLLTRKHLLEWQTAAQVKADRGLDLRGFYRQMAGSVGLAVGIGVLAVIAEPGAAWIVAPFVALWLAAPWIARHISLPGVISEPAALSDQDVDVLRRIARRTWLFFETFVATNEHGLPPDNYQDDPQPLIAHRTSPTNIGMYLLATVSARDFGWIGTVDMVERLEATLATVDRLERFHGHLYNWYDTQTLQRLEPEYVSTVDSGNLAGHLLAVANACRQFVDEPLALSAAMSGIGDALGLARDAAGTSDDAGTVWPDTPEPPDASTATIADWSASLERLSSDAAAIARGTSSATATEGDGVDELTTWATAALATADSHRRDLALVGTLDGVGAHFTLAELADQDAADRAAAGEPCQASVAALVRRLHALADEAQRLVEAMDFRFLFDPVRELFSIGFRVREGALDPSYYDLLASEARLTSFVAIAKGDVEPDHWFRLGRALTPVGRGSALISWSGSMFEYLMPSLVMRAPAGSLLEQTSRLVVARQIRYASDLGVPWGISESGYNARDLMQAYQYSGFGVPGLALKRGLGEDLVVAPYATALAAMVDPVAAVRNFGTLAAQGAAGRYGFREALDYTPRRLPAGASVAVINSYMAHHQGMALVALGNVVNDGSMVERFHADPVVEATELLLQERMPRNALVSRPRSEEVKSDADVRDDVTPILRRFTSPHDTIPRTHLLSNGRYSVMVTTAGSGYSHWRQHAVTRWREDVTCDPWGSFLYVRDTATGDVWSAGYQPSGREADTYEVSYSEDQATFARRDGSIATGLTIMVSAEDDAEIRRVSLTNLGSRVRELELTSYQEVVLAPQAADVAHPAFQNLFVQTEYDPETGALLATRRPRSNDEQRLWAAHVAMVDDQAGGVIQYETDRARFLGRGRSVRTAASVVEGRPLSNSVGAVLDPIFSLRRRVVVEPGETVHAVFATVVAESRDQVIDLADKYRTPATFERARILAWTHAQVQLHHLGIDAGEAHVFQRLANRLLYSDPSLRPPESVLAGNRLGAAALWPYGISGDLPIVVVRIDQLDDVDIVRQLLRAHEYWRLKGLDVDVVIVNEHGATYAEDLHESLESLVRASQSTLGHQSHPSHGGVFVLRGERLSADDRTLLLTAARLVLLSRHGRLADQVIRLERPRTETPRRSPATTPVPAPSVQDQRHPPLPQLEFFNGLGGFDNDGREYVIVAGPGQSTPAPWLNVIANSSFGFQVSESGAGYTWAGNSRENQLTPWSNDPVSDPPVEALYVRDDDSGEVWSPTAQPIRRPESTYVARHGAGYSRFQHFHSGVQLDLVQFVQPDAPVKLSVLTVANQSGRPRRLSVTAYAEWVLGTSRGTGAPWIITESEPATKAVLATNPWNAEFRGRVAFLDMGGRQTAWTADRTEFLGRNGGPERPAGLARGHELQQTDGAGLDPCAVLQTSITLAAGESTEIVVALGQAATREAAIELIRDARGTDHNATLAEIGRTWDDVQGTIQVRTPDRALDIMINGWLVYQTLACRLWARAALYQAGGAYGFRDQLQDVIALIVPHRQLAREHLLRAAGRQFVDGDVQHWWHPPSGRGVRTHISDDRLWLPYAVDRYLTVTVDHGVLDEMIPYLDGPLLEPDQHDAYFEPGTSSRSGTLYEHCAAAIDCSLGVGTHGLPLIGTGDWNDGFDRVGEKGQGESVWLGWFLYRVLAAFVTIAESRDDAARADRWRAHMQSLRDALEDHGMGRRLVPAGLLRRRHTARLGEQR